MADVLLDASALPFGAPAFDRIEAAMILPAFGVALAEAKTELERIAADPAPPDFENVVVALERSGERLARVRRIFHALSSAQATPAVRTIEAEVALLLTRHGSAVAHDAVLFARVHAVWAQREDLGLDEAQRRLLDRHHRGFVDGGALLGASDKARFAAAGERLAALSTRFGQNVLAATADWSMPLADGAELTLDRGAVEAFLATSTDRAARETVWRAFTGRCDDGPHDNRAIVREIAELRRERAALLGHACYADFALADTMAATPAAAEALLMHVWRPALCRAAEEQDELAALAATDGAIFAPWDWRFYAERGRQRRLSLDGAAVKAALPLERVRDAVFDVAGRLYGLRFERRGDLPGWHPDVAAWAVSDTDGRHRGLLYTDFLVRPEKHGGAWMGSLRVQQRIDRAVAPIVYVVTNFAAHTGLSIDEARTLFHEFGHALHALLSDVVYPGQSGTAVTRDFVELPSKIMEHWIVAPDLLVAHGVPRTLAEAIGRADDTGQGFATIEFLASALQDLVVHRLSAGEDPFDAAAEALRVAAIPDAIVPRHGLAHFTHIFDGGYAALYYGYLWSEVLDADAFDAFVSAGDLFDTRLSQRFRTEVLARGDTRDPMECFVAFRGRAPDVAALLRRRGFADA